MMVNPFSLENKAIIVTGASSGIGRQCAIDISKAGGRVILIARNKERLNETYSQLIGNGHQVFIQDILKISSSFINDVVEEFGQINGFVHCAGIEKTLPLKFLKMEDYRSLMETNTFSAFEIVRQLSNKKNISNGASIIFLSSISSLIGRGGLTAYAASKGAINSAIKVMALELAKRAIRVNAISPGTILTPMMEQALKDMPDEQRIKRIESFPLGLGKPEDISNACIYLLSDASRWITGQNLIIDGGYTTR